ncbi:hypothetical protein, partial [Vibrio parahaemolyticus]|uniref:hypothetical protein n=1 Tax=Vibrio parahaemolyticus TaxID=670 RepID=UPI001C5FC334
GINGKNFGVYQFRFLAFHRIKCAFHVLSGGTMFAVFASISPSTVSNFLAVSLARFLLCCWLLVFNSVLWCGCQSSVTESFANWKLVEIG